MSRFSTCFLAMVLVFPVAGAAESGFDPGVACNFMVEQDLRTRGGYRAVGSGYEWKYAYF